MSLRPVLASAALSLLPVSLVHAHDGHGLFGAHWHATDTLGFVLAAVAVGAVIWFGRGRK